ncbi:hypothetical protein MR942_10110 [bacterium]|nr:hypothetical protein [bacterium]
MFLFFCAAGVTSGGLTRPEPPPVVSGKIALCASVLNFRGAAERRPDARDLRERMVLRRETRALFWSHFLGSMMIPHKKIPLADAAHCVPQSPDRQGGRIGSKPFRVRKPDSGY